MTSKDYFTSVNFTELVISIELIPNAIFDFHILSGKCSTPTAAATTTTKSTTTAARRITSATSKAATTTKAKLIHMHLPSYSSGFESKAHHLYFYHL